MDERAENIRRLYEFLDDYRLSSRNRTAIFGALVRSGIVSVNDLMTTPVESLSKIRNIGKKRLGILMQIINK